MGKVGAVYKDDSGELHIVLKNKKESYPWWIIPICLVALIWVLYLLM